MEKKISFNLGKTLYDEFAVALKRFIGHVEGVESIDVEGENVVIVFDDSKITEEEISRIARDSIKELESIG
ncbi:MAG: hypothetical protein AB1638_03295 [Nitrospirota bacterium]